MIKDNIIYVIIHDMLIYFLEVSLQYIFIMNKD